MNKYIDNYIKEYSFSCDVNKEEFERFIKDVLAYEESSYKKLRSLFALFVPFACLMFAFLIYHIYRKSIADVIVYAGLAIVNFYNIKTTFKILKNKKRTINEYKDMLIKNE